MEKFRLQKVTAKTLTFIAQDDVKALNRFKDVVKYDVPSLAIDQVIVEENNTTYSNEFLAHRLMQMPIVSTSMHRFKMLNECDMNILPDQDPTCGSLLTLDVDNQSKTEFRKVTSLDLIPLNPGDPQPIGDVFEIMPLKYGERLKLKAIVRKGTGRIHVKFSPVSISIYGPNTGSMDNKDLAQWNRKSPWPWVFELETIDTLPAIQVFRLAETIYMENYPCLPGN